MFYNKIAFGQEVSFKLTTLRQELQVEPVKETAKPELTFDFFGKISEFFNKPIISPIVEEKEEELISESS